MRKALQTKINMTNQETVDLLWKAFKSGWRERGIINLTYMSPDLNRFIQWIANEYPHLYDDTTVRFKQELSTVYMHKPECPAYVDVPYGQQDCTCKQNKQQNGLDRN